MPKYPVEDTEGHWVPFGSMELGLQMVGGLGVKFGSLTRAASALN